MARWVHAAAALLYSDHPGGLPSGERLVFIFGRGHLLIIVAHRSHDAGRGVAAS